MSNGDQEFTSIEELFRILRKPIPWDPIWLRFRDHDLITQSQYTDIIAAQLAATNEQMKMQANAINEQIKVNTLAIKMISQKMDTGRK